jgi:hypothetical protein
MQNNIRRIVERDFASLTGVGARRQLDNRALTRDLLVKHDGYDEEAGLEGSQQAAWGQISQWSVSVMDSDPCAWRIEYYGEVNQVAGQPPKPRQLRSSSAPASRPQPTTSATRIAAIFRVSDTGAPRDLAMLS